MVVFGHGVISARVGPEPRSVVERMVDGGCAMKTLNGAKHTNISGRNTRVLTAIIDAGISGRGTTSESLLISITVGFGWPWR